MPSYTQHLSSWATASSGPPWVNPSNAEFVDAVVSTMTAGVTERSQHLIGLAPTSISPGAGEVLESVTLTITRSASLQQGSDNIVDVGIVLVSNNLEQPINKALLSTTWPLALTAQTYTWTAADLSSMGITLATIQQATSGASIAVEATTVAGVVASVDAAVLTITTVFPSEASSVFDRPVLPGFGFGMLGA